MQILDSIIVSSGTEKSSIELCCGDLTNVVSNEEADILVVSAFPNDYSPTATSLIGALDRAGLSVKQIAQQKAVDLRPYCCSWMSSDVSLIAPNLFIKRIFCFEPPTHGSPPQMVEDLFRGLAPFLNNSQPGYSIAMPLLATGDHAVPIVAMLRAIVQSAVRWISFGLPIRRLRIVEKSVGKADWMRNEFALVKRSLETRAESQVKTEPRLIRYALICAPEDFALRDELVRSLQSLRRQKILELWHEGSPSAGMDGEEEVQKHISEDDVILILVTPDYLASDRCMEHAELALRRHEQREVRLIPVLGRATDIATTPLSTLPTLPTDSTPITSWSDRDKAWTNVSGGIRLLSTQI